jgi:hypothetical protein
VMRNSRRLEGDEESLGGRGESGRVELRDVGEGRTEVLSALVRVEARRRKGRGGREGRSRATTIAHALERLNCCWGKEWNNQQPRCS